MGKGLKTKILISAHSGDFWETKGYQVYVADHGFMGNDVTISNEPTRMQAYLEAEKELIRLQKQVRRRIDALEQRDYMKDLDHTK